MSGNKTNVLRWAKAGGPAPAAPDPPPSAKAKEATAMLSPADETGRLKIPIPIGDDASYRGVPSAELQRKIREAKVERVPVASLHSNGQRSVGERGVQRFHDRPSTKARSHGGDHPVDHPIVIRQGGRHTIYDGHTRTTAAILKGETHLSARVVDLDDKPS